MRRYGMVIDLRKCVGCNACVAACKVEHNSPNGILLTSVLEKEVGSFPKASRIFLPVLCNHCAKPVCVDACPTGATYARDDGIVLIDWKRCIGCRACIAACPYGARFHVEDDRTVFPDGLTLFERPVHERIPRKVPAKCDFCCHRVDANGTPACVEVCPTEARIFGDLSDEQGEPMQLISRHYAWRLLPDKGTESSVYYIG